MHNVEFLDNNRLCRTKDEDSEGEDDDKTENPTLVLKFISGLQDSDMMSGNEWVPRSTQRNGSLRRVERSGYRCREQDENLRFVRESHASLSVEVQKRKRESSVLSSQLRLNLCLSRSQEGCTGLECVLQRLRYKLAGKAPTYPRQIVASTSKASTGVSEQTTAVRLETGLTWES